jgi:membrane-associated protein
MTHALTSLIFSFGYLGLVAVIFAETGLFFGFFLPGDSVLFTAGLLASQHYFSIWYLVLLVSIAAILGDSVGYWFGAKVGPHLFTREDSLFFKKRYIEETHAYFERFGASTIILARFVPIVRTFAPILAGVGRMRYSLFLRYNIVGGVLWGAGVTLGGYYLGRLIPNVDRYLLPIILLIIVVSALPIIFRARSAR